MKLFVHTFFFVILLASCTGSKKYFKAAEKLEKQGLVNEAAEFYMESLERKPTNVDARIKLKEVGQKYVSFMSSEFFRDYNTGAFDQSIEDFEKMKNFTQRADHLSVKLIYPPTYEDDYKSAIDKYCDKNYRKGEELVKQKKYGDALKYLGMVNKYQPEYKKAKELTITAGCEPYYRNAITQMENKAYAQAVLQLNQVHKQTDSYKDSKELLDLCNEQLSKSMLLFQPQTSAYPQIIEILFNSFSQNVMQEHKNVDLINNSPFVYLPGNNIENNVDLIQGIRKASGADYFYVFDVENKGSKFYGPAKTKAKCFRRFSYKKNDTVIVTEYQPTDYYQVKSKRVYTYTFKYKLVNALTNQIVSFQSVVVNKEDAVEYNEFLTKPVSSLDDYFPYNPMITPPMQQFNPRSWRALFTANKNVKSEEELEALANKDAVSIFSNSVKNYVK